MFTTVKPKISVCVPVYNAAPFIAETVKAVLRQDMSDFELLLVDDASTDDSVAIIKQFDDNRIRLFQHEHNQGISASRNFLLRQARGEYIAVLDNDDICLPNRLRIQAAFLDSHPDIAMVGSWFELFAPRTTPWWRRWLVNLGWVWCHPLFPTWHDAQKGNVIMHPTAMYRRKLLADCGICYDVRYTPAEDYDLVVQVLAAGLRLANIPQILLQYNLHGANCSLIRKRQMKKADTLVKQKIAGILSCPRRYYPYILVMLQKLRFKWMLKEK